MSAETFTFKFDGEAVQDGSIDIRDFAPAALAVGHLIEEANRVLNGESADAAVRLKADFRTGSFESFVQVSVSFLAQTRALLGGELKDAKDLIETLGFWGDVAKRGGIGFLALLKRLGGRRPRRGTVLSDGRVSLELPDGDRIEVSRDVANLYNDLRVLSAVKDMVRPLERSGISEITFLKPGADQQFSTKIEKEDLPAMLSLSEQGDELEPLHTSEYERVFGVLSPSFTGDYVWRLTDGDNRISAAMKDANFVRKVESGDIAFSAGSLIQAKVESVTSRTPTGKLSTRTEIKHVSRVIPPARQILLRFEAQEESSSSPTPE